MNTDGTTRTKAAKDRGETRAETIALVKSLDALAKEWEQCADRADTLDAEDTRRRSAAQLRFVAVLTGSADLIDLGRAWVDAGRRMLDAANLADMDAVHESRARRRGVL